MSSASSQARPQSSSPIHSRSPVHSPLPSPAIRRDQNPFDRAVVPNSIIDQETWSQLQELADGDDEFLESMITAYCTQASSTFSDMDKAVDRKDLPTLSQLGHFLKGSSAALGVKKVQLSCERMQHYGQRRDEEKNVDLTEIDALDKIKKLLVITKGDYKEAKTWLMNYSRKVIPDPPSSRP